MKAEFMGGPQDGHVVEIQNGTNWVTVPISEPIRSYDDAETSAITTRELPVVPDPRYPGRYIIIWIERE